MQSWLDQEESKIRTEQMWPRIHPDKKEDPWIIKKMWVVVILFSVFAISKSYGEENIEKCVVQCPICHSVFWLNPINIIQVEGKGKIIEGCLWKCLTCGNLQTNFSSVCVFCGSPK